MKIFVIVASLLFSIQSYSGVSNDIDSILNITAHESQRLVISKTFSSECKGSILGFNHALKLNLGKGLSNTSEFKIWEQNRLKKNNELVKLEIEASRANTAQSVRTAYSKAILKAKELQALDCNYWRKLGKMSIQQIHALIK